MFDKIRNVFDFRTTAPSPAQQPAGAAQSIPLRRLWWAAIVLLGLSASAVTWTIFQLRDDAIRAAISESGSIATVLAGQLSRSLQSIDRVLLDVKHSAEQEDFGASAGFSAEFDRDKFRDYLIKQLGQARQQVFGMAVTDKNGLIIVATLNGAAQHINISDRDYFQNARDRRDGELSISIPAANRINGEKTIVFARRLDGPKGEFAGIVLAAVSTKYFEDIYDAIQSVHSLLFTLLNPDGIILFRHPDDGDSTGRALSNKAQWLEALSKDDQVFRLLGKADSNVRYVSIRRVPEFPLIVDISLTESTVLDIWARRTGTIIVGSSVFLIFSLYLLAAMTRQVRSLSDSKASLAQKSQQLDAALNNMSQGLTMFDDRQHLIVSNTQFARIYGLTAEQTKPGTSLRSLLNSRKAVGSVPRDDVQFLTRTFEHVSNAEASDFDYTLLDGRTVSIAVQPMPNGGFVSIHQDITAQKRIEAELERRARYDALTGLANRTLLMEKIGEALARLGRQGEEFSILMLDLDRFKTVNDSFGHPAGDLLLKEVGRRLQDTTRDVDCVARLGGDEFAVLQVSDGNQVDGVIALCGRILKAITEPYDLEGRKLILETSIGIALAPRDGTDADVLIKNADLALYKAKAEGRNRYCFFEAGMEAKARERRELEDDMRKALERNEFEMYYQTIVDLERREYCGAEALLRWHHPERGLIPPDQFIPLAEESGLIVPLGQWILRQACAEAAKWPSHLKIAANLSPSQIKHGDLLDILKSALAETGLPPQRLQLEITETVLLERKPEHLAVLHEIKKLGVSVVLDDFGVGYSSMTYLQMFPFDRIKIDQSFIRSMTDHAAGAAIVCAIAGLGRTLDIATTAEGVETVEQLVFLRAAGCQFAQGYLFSRPVPASKLTFELPDALRRNLKAA